MLLYQETRTIHAPKQTVYDAVVAVENYKDWNPWICDVEGVVKKDAVLMVTAVMKNKRPRFKHRILATDRPDFFHWEDMGFFTYFAYGNRQRFFKALDENTTEYTCRLEVIGVLAFTAKWFFGSFMYNGMSAEADALKQYVEAKAS